MKRRTQMQRPDPALGTGLGKGPGPKPGSSFPPIIKTPLPAVLIRAQLAGQLEAYTQSYRMGELSILVSHEPAYGWHMSIAHPNRYPTWDEITHIRYTLLPDQLTLAMLLPPKSEYINVHANCFQLQEIRSGNKS